MKENLDSAKVANQHAALCQASGEAFYNTSKFTLRDLKARAKQQLLKADFEAYLDGFSPNVQQTSRRRPHSRSSGFEERPSPWPLRPEKCFASHRCCPGGSCSSPSATRVHGLGSGFDSRSVSSPASLDAICARATHPMESWNI